MTSEESPKVLLARPKGPGGVSYYYDVIQDHLRNVVITKVGSRGRESPVLGRFLRLLSDYIRFIYYLATKNIQTVHLNPAMDTKSLIRDGIHILLASVFRTSILVFFRGWDRDTKKQLTGWKRSLFLVVYLRVDRFLVLASSFREQLRELGLTQPIDVETTVVDESLLDGLDVPSLVSSRWNDPEWRILFLSRLIKEKGILHLIDSVNRLASDRCPVRLDVAGTGVDLPLVKKKIQKEGLQDRISLHGYVTGRRKRNLFHRNHLFCLPTNYREGLPNSLLEAMAFGLPVISTEVAGIPDQVVHRENGLLIKPGSTEQLAQAIKTIMTDRDIYRKFAKNNYKKARAKFRSSVVAGRINSFYKTMNNISTPPSEK